MALTTITVMYDSKTRQPVPAGDLATVVYRIDVLQDGGNAYPGGAGEPISFAAEFREVFAVSAADFGASTAPWPGEGLLVAYERSTVNTGVIRFFANGAAGTAGFDQLAAAPYPFPFRFRLLVVGRPITDAA